MKKARKLHAQAGHGAQRPEAHGLGMLPSAAPAPCAAAVAARDEPDADGDDGQKTRA